MHHSESKRHNIEFNEADLDCLGMAASAADQHAQIDISRYIRRIEFDSFAQMMLLELKVSLLYREETEQPGSSVKGKGKRGGRSALSSRHYPSNTRSYDAAWH